MSKIRPTAVIAVLIFIMGLFFDLNYVKYFIALGMLVYFSAYRVYYIWNTIIEILAVIAVICTLAIKDISINIYFLYGFFGLLFLDMLVIFILKNMGYPILKSEINNSN